VPSQAPRVAELVPATFRNDQIRSLIDSFFSALSRPVRKNLAFLVEAFIALTSLLRSCNGELSLASVARALPLGTSFKHRYKRLNRFLDNRLFDPQGVAQGLFAVVVGLRRQRSIPVVLDQSTLGEAQLLMAGVPFAGRVLPLGLMTFTYADIRNRPEREKSQNFVERLFFLQLLEAAGGAPLCFILDRGYARVSLMRELLNEPGAGFILRTRRNVTIERRKGQSITRCKVGSLKAPPGRPLRLEGILYRGDKPIELDLVIYYERGHKEAWYLLVPPRSRETLPDHDVVALYRQRMRIEQGFRDFKTHLGLRGLHLEVRVTERVQRLLLAFTLAYALVVALGVSKLAEEARERLEDSRAATRHGTARILSARSIAALLLCGLCRELLKRLTATIRRLIARALAGDGLYYVAARL
jgi:hypothetical protein